MDAHWTDVMIKAPRKLAGVGAEGPKGKGAGNSVLLPFPEGDTQRRSEETWQESGDQIHTHPYCKRM